MEMFMTRRTLDFRTFDDVAADVRHLHDHGCTPHGTWSFAQNCRHLAEFLAASMRGFRAMPEWAPYRDKGPAALRLVLQGRRMKSGFPLPDLQQPPADADADAWPERL